MGTRYYGGAPVADPSAAPWSVMVGPPEGQSGPLCSGSIVDATRVLTAAHCDITSEGQHRPPSAFNVYAGQSAFTAGADQNEFQKREVTAINVFPYYDSVRHTGDIAEFQVSPPFTFDGPGVQPIQVVGESQSLPIGGVLRGFGFGLSSDAGGLGVDRYLDLQLLRPWTCASGIPSVLCAFSESGSACHGDSGGGLTTTSSPGVLVGVTSTVFVPIGKPECAPGYLNTWTDLASPEIHQWLEGNGQPPRAPWSGSRPTMSSPVTAGQPVTCSPPAWEGGTTSLRTYFVNTETEQTLSASSSSTYLPSPTQVGHRIACVSVANNAGGSTEAVSARAEVLPSPKKASKILGRSRQLVAVKGRRIVRGRWRLTLHIRSPLTGLLATAEWSSSGCKRCRVRERALLHSRTLLMSPAPARGRRVQLTLKLPATKGSNWYAASVLRFHFGNRPKRR